MTEHLFESGILHADLDAFYATVEQRDDPSLRGQPISVGEGVVLAASYEAKRMGVRSGMGGATARRLCPGLISVRARMDAYLEASRAVFAIFDETTPIVEPLSIDEAFLDVRGLWRHEASPAAIGRRLRDRVVSEVGIVISVGAARTKFLAKVASGVVKPDGLLVVAPDEELSFLHALPVARVWGVGPVTQATLAERGIASVGDLAQVPVASLVHWFGGAAGRHLHELAWNRDHRRVRSGRPDRSIGSQQALGRRTLDVADVDRVLLGLADRVGARLRRSQRGSRTLTVRFRFGDFSRATRSRSFREPVSTTSAIHENAMGLATTLLDEPEGGGTVLSERGLTLLGIALSRFVPDDAVQLSLPFDRHDPRQVDDMVDEVRERFGRSSVKRAALLGARHVPTPVEPE